LINHMLQKLLRLRKLRLNGGGDKQAEMQQQQQRGRQAGASRRQQPHGPQSWAGHRATAEATAALAQVCGRRAVQRPPPDNTNETKAGDAIKSSGVKAAVVQRHGVWEGRLKHTTEQS
jgi:hypothetical protein